jgi:hypothetical protein
MKVMSKMKKPLLFFFVSAIFLMSITSICDSFHKNKVTEDKNNSKKISDAVMVSKQEIDDLVKKAAQQKYLQDVFNDDKTLPLTKSYTISLQPYQSKIDTKVQPVTQSPSLMRCSYNGQMYVAGDMVKTDQVWLRCTPTFYFLFDKPRIKHEGPSVWTLIQ